MSLLLVAAMVASARDLPSADPPAVMAFPAPALMVAGPGPETTTGQELTAGLRDVDEGGTTIR